MTKRRFAVLVALALAVCAWERSPVHAARAKPERDIPATTADAQATQAFEARLKDYLALHRKLEATLPKLPKEATPEQIDKHQRALAELIRAARSSAKQGEFFDHEMQAFVRRALTRVFAGRDAKAVKASIMDENPVVVKVEVNGRYPDDIPLATMPPEVLSALPKLEEDMEFRFVGDYLVLFDSHSHLIVDLMDDVLPV